MADWFTENFTGQASNEDFGAPSSETIDKIKRMNQAWERFSSVITDVNAKMATGTKLKELYAEVSAKNISSTTELLKRFAQMSKEILQSGESVKTVTQQLTVLGMVAGSVAFDGVKKLGTSISTEAKGIVGSTGKVVSSLAGIAKSFSASGGSLTSLSSFFLETLPKQLGQSLGNMGTLVGKIAGTVGKAAPAVVKGITAVVSKVLSVVPMLGSALSGVANVIGKVLGQITKVAASFLQGLGKIVEVAAPLIGGAIGAIGSIIQKAIEVALAEGQLKLAAFEKFSDMMKAGGGVKGEYDAFMSGRGEGRGGLWGKVGKGSGVSDYVMMDVAANFFKGAEGAITKAVESGKYAKVWSILSEETQILSQTYFSGLNMAGFIRDVARQNQVAGEDLIDSMARTSAAISGPNSPLYNMAATAKDAGMEVKAIVGPMMEFRDQLVELNMGFEESAGLITKVVQMGSILKNVGIDATKSAGKISKEIGGLFKKWDKGLRAFVAVQAFGKQNKGNIFASMNMAEFGGKGFKQMLTPVFDMMDGITKGMDKDAALFTKRHFLETTMGVSEETARAMAEGGRELLNDPAKLQAIVDEQKRMANPQVTIMNQGQRQIEIQSAMVNIQKSMLQIMRATAELTFNFLARIVRTLFDIVISVTSGFSLMVDLLKIVINPARAGKAAWDAFSGNSSRAKTLKGKMGAYNADAEAQMKKSDDKAISDIRQEFKNIVGEAYRAFKLMGADPELVKKTGEQIVHGAQKTTSMIQLKSQEHQASASLAKIVATNADLSIAEAHIEKMKLIVHGSGSSTKKSETFGTYSGDKKHFGGALQKFHFGGIIKTGNEALLMSPNPTSVLSPADTRQAVRGDGKPPVINVNFSGPVYGIPKFEEMVKRMVVKAATAR